MLHLGFSTGALAFHDYARALALLENTSASAVELSALRLGELPGLLKALPMLLGSIRKRYDYVSFHAPTDFEDEHTLVDHLTAVADLEINVVVHPDTIKDPAVWAKLGSRLCLENMDSRKATGRTSEELTSYFAALPHAKLCFDIAHAKQVDPTMTEASRILRAFGGRLAQVHLSEVNSNGKHFAVSLSARIAYEPFSGIMSSVPVIIESVVDETKIESEIILARALLSCESNHKVVSARG